MEKKSMCTEYGCLVNVKGQVMYLYCDDKYCLTARVNPLRHPLSVRVSNRNDGVGWTNYENDLKIYREMCGKK